MTASPKTPTPPSLLSRLDLPRTLIIVAVIALVGLIVFYGPEDVRTPAAMALIGIVALMKSIVRPAGGGAAAVILALVLAPTLTGCGASTLRVHAIAADTSGRVLDTTCEEIRTARTAETQAVPHTTREETQELVDAVRARWAPAVSSCNLLAAAHGAWVDVLVHAVAGGELDLTLALPLALRVATGWADLVPLATAVGIPLPPPPTELAQLTAGVR